MTFNMVFMVAILKIESLPLQNLVALLMVFVLIQPKLVNLKSLGLHVFIRIISSSNNMEEGMNIYNPQNDYHQFFCPFKQKF